MLKTIMVVDDDTEIAQTLQEFLTAKEYKVVLAQNAAEAFKLIENNKIDIILSDIQMPDKSGLDLFQEFKEKIDTQNAIPFILMTGFADTISVKNAFGIGVSELIAKPFDLEAVGLVIDYLLESERSHGSESDTFFSVPIQDIILSKTSDYTIFLKVAEKHVRVTKSGQDFTPQRLDNFAKKGVKNIYLNAIDFAKYTDLHFAIASTVIKRPMEEVKKMRLMNQLISSVSQNSIANQMDKEYFDQSIQSFEAYTQVAMNHSQLNNILSFISSDNASLADQSTLKAILSSSVASLWKWTSPKVQSRIILAALFSDIGLKDFKHLLLKKRFEYTPEEAKQYEQHPIASYEILKQIDGIPEEILYVAIQHHENAVGLGFPQRLPRSKIHAYSKIVQGVGVFIESLHIQNNKTDVKNALDVICRDQGKTVSEQVIKSLYMIFQLEVPKSLSALLMPTDTTRVI
mgnify:CR=1 FL=1